MIIPLIAHHPIIALLVVIAIIWWFVAMFKEGQRLNHEPAPHPKAPKRNTLTISGPEAISRRDNF